MDCHQSIVFDGLPSVVQPHWTVLIDHPECSSWWNLLRGSFLMDALTMSGLLSLDLPELTVFCVSPGLH